MEYGASRIWATKCTTTSYVGKDNSGKILQLQGTSIRDCPVLVALKLAIWKVIKTVVQMKMDNIIVESDSQVAN